MTTEPGQVTSVLAWPWGIPSWTLYFHDYATAPVYRSRSAHVTYSRHLLPLLCKRTIHCAFIWLCSPLVLSYPPHPPRPNLDLSLRRICMKHLLLFAFSFLIILFFLRLQPFLSSHECEFPTKGLSLMHDVLYLLYSS